MSDDIAAKRDRVWRAFRRYARTWDNDLDPAAIACAKDICGAALDAYAEAVRVDAVAVLPCYFGVAKGGGWVANVSEIRCEHDQRLGDPDLRDFMCEPCKARGG